MAGFLSIIVIGLVCVSLANGRSIRSVVMCNPELPSNKIGILREAETKEANREITYETVNVTDYMEKAKDNSESVTCDQPNNLPIDRLPSYSVSYEANLAHRHAVFSLNGSTLTTFLPCSKYGRTCPNGFTLQVPAKVKSKLFLVNRGTCTQPNFQPVHFEVFDNEFYCH